MKFIDSIKGLGRHFSAKQDLADDDASINDNCPAFEVNNWVISKFVLSELLPIVGVHPFPLNELMLMSGAICRLRPTHVFEWGTHIGKSARIFYETSRYFKIECEVHSVDLPDYSAHKEHPGRRRGELVKKLRNVYLHQGDGLDTSLKICADLKDTSRLLFFLDGDHRYESIRREIGGVTEKIPNAWIIVHDTFYQTEVAAYNIGPHQAVREFLRKNGNRYSTVVQNTGRPGMVLLYPGEKRK